MPYCVRSVPAHCEGIDINANMLAGRRYKEIVHKRRAGCPRVMQNANLVGPMEDAWIAVETTIVGLIVVVVVIQQGESERASASSDSTSTMALSLRCFFPCREPTRSSCRRAWMYSRKSGIRLQKPSHRLRLDRTGVMTLPLLRRIGVEDSRAELTAVKLLAASSSLKSCRYASARSAPGRWPYRRGCRSKTPGQRGRTAYRGLC